MSIIARVLFGLWLLGFSVSASAQLVDISPFAILAAEYDDNVFRTDRSAAAGGEARRADARWIATAGLTGEFEPGLQAVNLTGAVERFQYMELDPLDHNAYQLDGRWDWQVGRRFDGLLRAGLERTQDDFRDRDGPNPSFTLDRVYEARGAYNLSPAWRAELGGRFNSRAGSEPNDASFNLDERTFDVAGFYRSDPIGQVGLAFTYVDGRYPKRGAASVGSGLATEFDQITGELRVRWAPSAISSLDGAIGVTRREQSPSSDRDFSGVTGRLDYRRRISGRTLFVLRGFRRVWSTEQVDANFATDSGASAELEWSWSVKTSVTLEGEWRAIRYQSDTPTATVAASREDDISRGVITIAWQPLERLGFRLSGERELRDSNQIDESYDAWISRLSMRVGF